LVCRDPDERVAPGREVVLLRALLEADFLDLLSDEREAEVRCGAADELSPGERLDCDFNFGDCKRVRAWGSSFPPAGGAESDDPSFSSRLRLANSMTVVRALWWRS
jgi:hypothetical protein